MPEGSHLPEGLEGEGSRSLAANGGYDVVCRASPLADGVLRRRWARLARAGVHDESAVSHRPDAGMSGHGQMTISHDASLVLRTGEGSHDRIGPARHRAD